MSIHIDHRVSQLLRASQNNLDVTRNNLHRLVQSGTLDNGVGNELQGIITATKQLHDAVAALVHDLRRVS